MKHFIRLSFLAFALFPSFCFADSISGPAGTFVGQFLNEGSTITRRSKVNWIGAGVDCVDNSGDKRTDCTVSGSGGSGGGYDVEPGTVTFNLPLGASLSTMTITSLTSKDCLGTDGSGNVIEGSCGGSGGGSALEVFSNFDSLSSSPTASIGLGDAMKLTVSGSTGSITVDFSSVASRGDVILNQNTLQSGATASPDFVNVYSSMTVNGPMMIRGGILDLETTSTGINMTGDYNPTFVGSPLQVNNTRSSGALSKLYFSFPNDSAYASSIDMDGRYMKLEGTTNKIATNGADLWIGTDADGVTPLNGMTLSNPLTVASGIFLNFAGMTGAGTIAWSELARKFITHSTWTSDAGITVSSGAMLSLTDNNDNFGWIFKATGTMTGDIVNIGPPSTGTVVIGQVQKVVNVDGKNIYWGYADDNNSGGGGGYALEPATITPSFPLGFSASTGVFSSGLNTSTFSVTSTATFSGPINAGGVGTSGQFLTSGGDGVAPSWTTPSASGASNTPLEYATIYSSDNASATDIVTQNVYVQILAFDLEGPESVLDGDHTNDHIAVANTGKYLINGNFSFSGGASNQYEIKAFLNDGVTALHECYLSRVLGSGGDVGSAGFACISSLTAGDTIEVWVRNTSGTGDATFQESNLSVLRVDVGGSEQHYYDDGIFVLDASSTNVTAPLTITSASGFATLGVDSSSVTLQGNTFNTANKLLQLDGSADVPDENLSANVSLLGSQIDIGSESNATASNGVVLTDDDFSIDWSSAISRSDVSAAYQPLDATLTDLANAPLTEDNSIDPTAIASGAFPSDVIISSVAVNTVGRSQLSFSSMSFTSSYKAAVCQGPNASLGFSGFAASTPTAACVNVSSAVFGVAQFMDSGSTQTVHDHFQLPTDWVGEIDANIVWRSTATSSNIVWQLRTSCVADGEVANTTWNTASTVTDAAKGTTLQFNTAAITGVSTSNCSAGEELFFEFFRDPTHASDTLASAGELISLMITIRRTF